MNKTDEERMELLAEIIYLREENRMVKNEKLEVDIENT